MLNTTMYIRSKRIIVRYTIIGFIWLAISTPLMWFIRQDFLPIILFRILYVIISALLLYLIINRELILSHSRHEYDQLLDTMLDPVLIHVNGLILDANPPAARFFNGDSKDDLLNQSILEFVHKDYQDIAKQRIKQLTDGKPTHIIEEKFITLHGEIRDVEIAGIPITFQGSRAILIIFRDITNRKQIETSLRDSEDRLRTLINAIPDAICFIDNEGHWTEANRPMLRSTGLGEKAYRGKTSLELSKLCHPKFRDAFVKNPYFSATTFEQTKQFTHEFEDLDGTQAFHDVTQVPIKTDNHSNWGIVIISRNVTAERLALKQLMESEQRYRSLFDNDGDMIVSIDTNGIICTANPACEITLGYTAGELIGRHYIELLAPECLKGANTQFRRVMQGELQSEFTRMLHKDASQIEVYAKKIPIVIDNKTTGFFWIIRDLTDQRVAENLLVKSERLSAVGELAAGIAHEIRNPLTTLKGFVQLMLTAEYTEKSYLMVMKGELERVEHIVNELLVFSKPSVPLMQQHSCISLLQEVTRLMFPQATLKNIEIVEWCEFESIVITCDKNRLKQVLVNLIKNAIEAMPNGGVIETGVRASEAGTVSIYVRDNGPGIPENEVARLGEPFYTTKATGTGLGLMVSRRIVESHQGTLRIHSQVGVGTEIEMILPVTVQSVKTAD